MIEGCLLESHAIVRERDQKAHQLIELLGREPARLDVRIEVSPIVAAEVATAVVELDDLAQRGEAAAVHVRREQLLVAQPRSLERAVDRITLELVVERLVSIAKAIPVGIAANDVAVLADG